MRDAGYFVKRANQYIKDVLNNKIPACIYVKQACQRQHDDLIRSKNVSSKFEYKFNKQEAERVCQFIEMLPHVEGKWARKNELITLEPFQCFILTTCFGWIDKKTKARRFRIAYNEMPRKNGKSALSSGVGLYMTCADGEQGSQVYSAATTKEQAKIVFETARQMVLKSKAIQNQLGMKGEKYSIYQESTGSSFRALSRDHSGNLDGLNIHCAVVDELHAHKDRSTWDVLETGVGAREQPMIWAITTAGFNRNGICYEQRSYATKILDGTIQDDSYFAIIFTIDKEDDWKDPASWAKANPNWGVSVNVESIENAARKAVNQASAQNNFKTKHLNVWVNSNTAWMNMSKWDECEDLDMNIEEFEDDECILAVDLAKLLDFSSTAKIFRRKIDEEFHYYAFMRHYINDGAVDENSHSDNIRAWIDEGHIHCSDGDVTDYNLIEEEITQDCRDLKVKDVCFDPYDASMMMQNLSNKNISVISFNNNAKNMSEPTKELEALVHAKRFHHDGDPVLAWMISNVLIRTDGGDRVFARRDTTMPHNKIDGAIAVIMALGRFMQTKEREPQFQAMIFQRRR